jgi:hypothetical protein
MSTLWSNLRLGAFAALAFVGVAVACAKGAPIDNTPSPTCTGSQVLCSDVCADTQTDTENCGLCGLTCTAGQACVAGKCSTSCPSGDSICKGSNGKSACVNERSDNTNCGGCGKSCKAGEICFNSICNSTCGDAKSGQIVCGADGGSPYCANPKNDNANCGKCGNACPGGQVCTNGACAGSCSQDQTQCGGDGGATYCANLQTDNAHCGDCAVSCGLLQACVAGACVSQCSDSQLLCKATDGGVSYCTDYLSDNNNCGKCGNVCPSNKPLCTGGTCSDGSCNRTVLLLGDTNASSNAGYVSILQAAGFTVNSTYTTNTYSGSPAASGFGLVVVSPGTTYTNDMPVAGQQSIVTAQAANTGVYITEWVAYQIGNGQYATFKPLLLFPRTSGNTSALTFTNTVVHPIWNGLPSTFTSATLGSNIGSVLNAGATQIATCSQCTGIGVAVKDQGQGRIVQVAHAAGYSGSWWTDPNLSKLMSNAALWAARCN